MGHDLRHAVPHEDEPARDATVAQARENCASEMRTVEEVRRCCRGKNLRGEEEEFTKTVKAFSITLTVAVNFLQTHVLTG